MNITEFAEQIVFTNSLEEKLAAPGKLSFDRLRSSKLPSEKSLRSPGRPADLLMQHDPGKNVQPPKENQLEGERARGKLLHFLANHELLATELMALVLLKFPEAPRSFRQGVLVTLQEEQQHTQMYLKRMEHCGVEFGTYPVSGQFWRFVEPMQSPMDFVSRLSLTFEQANLDYSLHFANVFHQIGDVETSSLLRKIYEDEISHVQHGLQWFRQWKDPEKSDWDAWNESLEFPVSPARGRGPRSAFNREGRRKAGLSDSFINSIEVFGQSKDRSAVVRWFNSGVESELSETGSEDAKLDQINQDLEHVLLAVAKPDDVLLVRSKPDQRLRKHWIELGFELPEFCSIEDLESLQHRKLNRAEPWAWSPNAIERLSSIENALRHNGSVWSDRRSQLYRKSFGIKVMSRFLDDEAIPDWMAGRETLGIEVGTEFSLLSALGELKQRGFKTALFKPELSASGRGMHRISTESQKEKTFTRSVEAVVEPFLDRVVDVSFLWKMQTNGTTQFLGWSRQMVSKGGRYECTVLGRPFEDCDADVRQFLLANQCSRLKETARWLESGIGDELRSRGHVGCFGVDAFVFRDDSNNLKMRPFVELNPRMTMGHVAIALQKRIASGVKAIFHVMTRSEFENQRREFEAIPFLTTKDGRWTSGVVKFGDFTERTKLVPLIVIGEDNKKGTSLATSAFDS